MQRYLPVAVAGRTMPVAALRPVGTRQGKSTATRYGSCVAFIAAPLTFQLNREKERGQVSPVRRRLARKERPPPRPRR